MGRHPDDVCVFCLDSFGFAQITSDRLGFCHTAGIPARNLGRERLGKAFVSISWAWRRDRDKG